MKYPYQDPGLPVEARVADLLSRMTLEEKFAQMRLIRPTDASSQRIPFDLSLLERNRHRIGAIYNAGSMPEETVRAIQDWVKGKYPAGHSRGIPRGEPPRSDA